MAQDWIKIEKCTPKKREIFLIAKDLNISTNEAFALCFQFWAWADDNLADPFLGGMTLEHIDSIVSQTGFGEAILNAGWLSRDCHGLMSIPHFDYHLSNSAKVRASTLNRQRKCRKQKPKS